MVSGSTPAGNIFTEVQSTTEAPAHSQIAVITPRQFYFFTCCPQDPQHLGAFLLVEFSRRSRLPRFVDTPSYASRTTISHGWPMRLLRRRGDRVVITTGEYAGYNGTVEANVYQRIVDYPYEITNGFHNIWCFATRALAEPSYFYHYRGRNPSAEFIIQLNGSSTK